MIFHSAKGKKRASAWLASMGDMLALMVTFFVLLFSMSSLVNQEFISAKTVAEVDEVRKIANRFNYTYSMNFRRDNIAQPTRYIYKVIAQHTHQLPGFEDVKITLGKGWIIITIYNSLLFHPNGDRLTPAGKILLLDVIDLLEIYQNRMEIIGNVSPEQPLIANVDSRWLLGLAYANTIRQYLFNNGVVRNIAIGSRAWQTQDQVSQAFSPEEREKLVNRIEFVIYDVE